MNRTKIHLTISMSEINYFIFLGLQIQGKSTKINGLLIGKTEISIFLTFLVSINNKNGQIKCTYEL